MKRLYERIPLRSVLYCIRGDQEIRIVDGGGIIYEGILLDVSRAQRDYKIPYKIDRAEIHGIGLDDGVMVFEIDTKYEEF